MGKHIELKPFTWIYPNASLISRCDLDLYLDEEKALVIARDRGDNREIGISVEKGAAIIAGSVMRKYGFHPENLTWIEAVPHPESGRTVYRQVVFETQGGSMTDSQRVRIDRDHLAELIGEFDA